jgi:hypothetical protein
MSMSDASSRLRIPALRPAGLNALDRLGIHLPGALLIPALLFGCGAGWSGSFLIWAVCIAAPALFFHQLRRVEVIIGPTGTRERLLARLDDVMDIQQILWIQNREFPPTAGSIILHLGPGKGQIYIGCAHDKAALEALQAGLKVPAVTEYRRKPLRVTLLEALAALVTGALYTWPIGFGALLMMPRAHRLVSESEQNLGTLTEDDPRVFFVETLSPVVGLAVWCLLVPFIPASLSWASLQVTAGTMLGSLLATILFQTLACAFIRRSPVTAPAELPSVSAVVVLVCRGPEAPDGSTHHLQEQST